jgi:hypothetical protein
VIPVTTGRGAFLFSFPAKVPAGIKAATVEQQAARQSVEELADLSARQCVRRWSRIACCLSVPTDFRASRLAWPLIALSILGHSSVLLAQDVRTLPPPQLVPLHSTMTVRALPPPSPSGPLDEKPLEVKPFLVPDPEGLRRWKEYLEQVPQALPEAPGFIEDTASRLAPKHPEAPVISRQFEGLANSDNAAILGAPAGPPDPNLGVGPAHIFQMVNSVGRITDKIGGNISTFSLKSFFGVDPGFREADPRVIYDAVSGHWFAIYLQFSEALGSSSLIVAVSTTSDPTGTPCRYRIGNPISETFLQDFPILGVSDDKVVVSYNGYEFPLDSQKFKGTGYYVLNKADLLACTPSVQMIRVPPDSSRFTQYPAQSLTSTSDLFMVMHWPIGNSLTLFTIRGVPGLSTVTGVSTSLPMQSWFDPPDALQPGSGVLLKTKSGTGDARVLSAAWQNHSLWLAGNEGCMIPGDTLPRSCLRIIELRTDTISVRQDITFGSSGEYYYYPAIRPDSAGNVHAVFTRSSTSSFASVRVTGRLATDPLNAFQGSSEIRTGGGAQTSSEGRMGDYSGAGVDPSDPLTVWVIGEYIKSTADADWGTYVAQLRFPASPVAISDFVTRLYLQVLGRAPDQAGLQAFVQQIQQFGSVVPTVFAFFHSQEFLNRNTSDSQFLNILYLTFLNRPADPGGFLAFLAALQSGQLTRDNLLDIFMDSQEFANLANFLPPQDPVTAFVTNLYVRILGRGPDQAGLQGFVNQLNQTRTVLPTVLIFLHSPEFLAKNTSNIVYVTVLYRVFLDRIPDAAGLAGWVAVLNTGTATRDQLAAQFAASAEFQAIQHQLFP